MSDISEDLEEKVRSLLIGNAFQVAVAALIIYEHILTIGEKIRLRSSLTVVTGTLVSLNTLVLTMFAAINIMYTLSWGSELRVVPP